MQNDPGCLPLYEEALSLFRRIQDRQAECNLANSLGNAYLYVQGLRDLDQAQRWYQLSLDLEPEHNRVGKGKSLVALAGVDFERFLEAHAAHKAAAVLVEHLNTALAGYQQALTLFPADDAEDLGITHNQLGNIYEEAGDTRRAMDHYQQAIRFKEARSDIYGAGPTRYNIAVLLGNDSRPGDALHYARAALHDFQRTGPGAAQQTAITRDLITQLEEAVG